MAKHRPSLENCQVVAKNQGLCENEEFGGSKGWEVFNKVHEGKGKVYEHLDTSFANDFTIQEKLPSKA